MKRLLPIAILALMTAGCNTEARRLVGTWFSPGLTDGVEQQITLTEDGQFRLWTRPRFVMPGQVPITEVLGRYTVEAGKLTLTTSAGSMLYKIASVTESTLVLETATGPIAVTSYARVPQRR